MERKSLLITDMDLRGRGIGKADGKAVFIPGAVVGDTVSYETSVSKKRYEIGKLSEIISPSSERRESPCAGSEICGGCTFMSISRECELDVKRRAVESAFRRAGIKDVKVSKILSGNCRKYRNKAVFHRGNDGKYGFFSSGTKDLYHPDACLLIPDIFNEIIKYTEGYFSKNRCPVPRSIMFRSGNDGIMVVAETTKFGDCVGFLKDLRESFPAVLSEYECIGYPTDAKTEFRHVAGSGYITVSFCENRLQISPRSFFQINTEIAELFCKEISQKLSPDEGDLILDLYCGIGTIGLSVAKAFPQAKIIGIEINDSAIADAQQNCELSEISNAEFICSDAGHADYEGLSPYALIVDPPRYGLSDSMIKNILKIAPRLLIYMSCDPGTLAGNATKLLAGGYKISDCTAGDMFPYSPHIETLCIFENNE